MDEKTQFLESLEKKIFSAEGEKVTLPTTNEIAQTKQNNQITQKAEKEKKLQISNIIKRTLIVFTPLTLEIIIFYCVLVTSLFPIFKAAIYADIQILTISMFLQTLIIIIFIGSLPVTKKEKI